MCAGAGQSRSIVNDLARDLKIDPELSKQLATMSKSGQPYLYAVSTHLPVKRETGKYDYAYDVSREKLRKSKRGPQPLPHPYLRVRENSGMDQNHRRPLSLNDLRPPPNSPPPPLPTNGKDLMKGLKKNLNSSLSLASHTDILRASSHISSCHWLGEDCMISQMKVCIGG